jgi:hypothetical protein
MQQNRNDVQTRNPLNRNKTAIEMISSTNDAASIHRSLQQRVTENLAPLNSQINSTKGRLATKNGQKGKKNAKNSSTDLLQSFLLIAAENDVHTYETMVQARTGKCYSAIGNVQTRESAQPKQNFAASKLRKLSEATRRIRFCRWRQEDYRKQTVSM